MQPSATEKNIGRKSLLAVAAALSCILVYMLACVMSPVTWSPDSSKIALIVTPSGDAAEAVGLFTWDTVTGKRELLDAVLADGIISSPSWSPDGKWIAYFKVEPKPVNGSDCYAATPASDEAVLPLLGEKNDIVPHFLFEYLTEQAHGELKDANARTIRLMAISPDGKEKKTLAAFALKAYGQKDQRNLTMTLQPRWAKDSQRIFYPRMIDEDLFYIASLDLAGGKTMAHLYSSTGSFSLSPDGKWVASMLEDKDGNGSHIAVTMAAVDGSGQKYFATGLSGKEVSSPWNVISWSGDSERVLVSGEDGVSMLSTRDGVVRTYPATQNVQVAGATFSPDGTRAYCVVARAIGEPNSGEQAISVESLDLKTANMKEITPLPKLKGLGNFAVSPNGKAFLIRGTIEEKDGKETSEFILCRGKEQKVVLTDEWMEDVKARIGK
jgi:Tol biopolymer transport system component